MKKPFRLLPLLVCALMLVGCRNVVNTPATTVAPQTTTAQTTATTVGETDATGEIKMHFISVGQGDSILLTTPQGNMLVDAGTAGSGNHAIGYMKSLGIKRIDYLFATHPHNDHIGGLKNVVGAFDIGKVSMPKIDYGNSTYENLLKTIEKKGLKITSAKAGQKYNLGDVEIQVLAPVKDTYEKLNEYSVVLKVVYKNTSFLLTGDMEIYNETELLSGGADVSADVLKVAHHGSSTSSSARFINAVHPKYSVISVGKGNDYGHPHKRPLNRLENASTVYRTDINGTVVITSDGKNLSVKTERE